MKLSLDRIALLLVVVSTAAALSGCGVVNRIRAKNALNEGARAYKDGRFDEAEAKFRYAYGLDPTQKLAPLFIARAVQQQYKPGVDTDENKEKANRAIEAYKQVLASDSADPKHKDDAFNAVAYLYRQMRDEASEEQWILQRANDTAAPAEKRSDAYTILASKQWNCSYEITERKENKETIDKKEQGIVIQYKKPADPNDFARALACIDKGTELVNKGVELNRENPNAWSYKTNLLRERAKLAQMDGKADEKARLDAEANEAEKEQRRLNDLAKEKKAAEEKEKAAPPAAS